MKLSRFNIIVAHDDSFGISREGKIPWCHTDDMSYFKSITTGSGNNVVIMGRITFESLKTPLVNRHNIVITSNNISITNNECTTIECANSLQSALQLTHHKGVYDQIWVIGGKQLYQEAIDLYWYLCDHLYISHIPGNHNCDLFFPEREKWLKFTDQTRYIRKIYSTFEVEIIPFLPHPEEVYLDMLHHILDNGEERHDRTGTGTKSLFGEQMKFDLRLGFPAITTKRLAFESIKRELLFFLSGHTDTKELESQNVNIWKGNTSKEFLTQRGLPWQEGDMGPGYGFQWRHSGALYEGCHLDYNKSVDDKLCTVKESRKIGLGIDQIKQVIKSINEDPYGRRHIVSAWNVIDIPMMALPPCHTLFQFYVSSDKKYLDCMLYQRSADMFLGVPFNIASYALLMTLIGKLTNLTARYFIHNLGDAHIYFNHINQVKEQLERTPLPLSTIEIREIYDIDDLTINDIILKDYTSWPVIKAPMAI